MERIIDSQQRRVGGVVIHGGMERGSDPARRGSFVLALTSIFGATSLVVRFNHIDSSGTTCVVLSCCYSRRCRRDLTIDPLLLSCFACARNMLFSQTGQHVVRPRDRKATSRV